jgi:hypothetical protein
MLEDSAVGEDGTQIPHRPLHVLISSFGQFTTGINLISRVQITNWKVGTGACNQCLTLMAQIHPSGNSSLESKRNKVCSTVYKFKWKEVTQAQHQRNMWLQTNADRRSYSHTNRLKTRMTTPRLLFAVSGEEHSMCVEPIVTLVYYRGISWSFDVSMKFRQ